MQFYGHLSYENLKAKLTNERTYYVTLVWVEWISGIYKGSDTIVIYCILELAKKCHNNDRLFSISRQMNYYQFSEFSMEFYVRHMSTLDLDVMSVTMTDCYSFRRDGRSAR